VAIILDGNRRYAKKLGIPKFSGHEKGMGKIKELLRWCIELKIREVTLYCFSTENFKREKEEVEYLFELFKRKVRDFKKEKLIHDNKVKVTVIGRIEMFPKEMQNEMREIIQITKDYKNYKLNLAMAYGGRAEIVDSFKRIIAKGIKKIDEETIRNNLYLPSDVDLLIRPGGEKRLSNFLLWQMAYGEIIWVDKLWPEFTKDDFIACINEFQRRERRFGK